MKGFRAASYPKALRRVASASGGPAIAGSGSRGLGASGLDCLRFPGCRFGGSVRSWFGYNASAPQSVRFG